MAVPRACFGCTPFASRTRVRSRSGVDCVEELCFGAACLLVDPGRLGVVVAGAPGEGPRTANEGASGDAEAPGASDAISDPATARAATEAPTRDVRNGPPRLSAGRRRAGSADQSGCRARLYLSRRPLPLRWPSPHPECIGQCGN